MRDEDCADISDALQRKRRKALGEGLEIGIDQEASLLALHEQRGGAQPGNLHSLLRDETQPAMKRERNSRVRGFWGWVKS